MSVHLAVFLAALNQIGLKGSKMLVALYAIELHASPFAIGISHVASQNLVGSLGDADARTSNFGTFSLGAAIAGMIGPMLVGFMVDRAGYSMSYFALAAISIIPGNVLLCYAGFIPAKIISSKEPVRTGGVRELLEIRRLRNTLLTSGVILTGIDLFNFYMPIHGCSIGLTASVIGVIIGMQAAAAFVVRLWMPWMARKYDEMRILTQLDLRRQGQIIAAACHHKNHLCIRQFRQRGGAAAGNHNLHIAQTGRIDAGHDSGTAAAQSDQLDTTRLRIGGRDTMPRIACGAGAAQGLHAWSSF